MKTKFHSKQDEALFNRFEEVARGNGWEYVSISNVFGYDESENYNIELGRISPAGQDFNISLPMEKDGTLEELQKEAEGAYENFDASYEAYLWLDDSGHGKNGAPYEMIDVYNDMAQCREYIKELSDSLFSECGK